MPQHVKQGPRNSHEVTKRNENHGKIENEWQREGKTQRQKRIKRNGGQEQDRKTERDRTRTLRERKITSTYTKEVEESTMVGEQTLMTQGGS